MAPSDKEIATERVVERLREEIRVGKDRLRQGEAASWEPVRAQQVAAPARTQERPLEQMERGTDGRSTVPARAQVWLDGLSDVERALRETCRRLGDGLGQLDIELRRLSDEVSRLAQVAGWLDAGQEKDTFQPGEAIRIALAAVPDFPVLMDMQRALSALPGVADASVIEFEDGVALLELKLHAPVSAQQVIERLQAAAGQRLLVEGSRPEALRLGLRFAEQVARGPSRGRLLPELWPKA